MQRGTRPWLPGSMPMPEPFADWTSSAPASSARTMPDMQAASAANPLPAGYYMRGKPQNVVNAYASLLESENELETQRRIYYEHNAPPVPAPVTPTPVITVLTPPDAVASGTAPISLQVTGSNFKDVSKVFFNGVAQPTMFYTEAKLVAEVQKLAIGYYPVVVHTADKVSNTVQFRFR